MALDEDTLDQDVEEIIGDLKTDVIIDSVTYDGSLNTIGREDLMIDEGLRRQIRFSVFLQTGDLATTPVEGDIATVKGVSYRILAISEDAPQQLFRIDLGEQYAER